MLGNGIGLYWVGVIGVSKGHIYNGGPVARINELLIRNNDDQLLLL